MCVQGGGAAAQVALWNPLRQMTQQAGPRHSLMLMEPGNESLSPAPGSTVSAAGAGWPRAAGYSPLIKGGMEGAREAKSPTPTSPPSSLLHQGDRRSLLTS